MNKRSSKWERLPSVLNPRLPYLGPSSGRTVFSCIYLFYYLFIFSCACGPFSYLSLIFTPHFSPSLCLPQRSIPSPNKSDALTLRAAIPSFPSSSSPSVSLSVSHSLLPIHSLRPRRFSLSQTQSAQSAAASPPHPHSQNCQIEHFPAAPAPYLFILFRSKLLLESPSLVASSCRAGCAALRLVSWR